MPQSIKEFPGLQESLAYLWQAADGRLVLCAADRSPLPAADGRGRISWYERHSWETVKNHALAGGIIGWLPGDLGYAALDLDQGEAAALIAAYPPRLQLQSRTAGHLHLIYDEPPANAGGGKWQALGAGGEVKHRSGYIALWYGGGDALAAEHRNPKSGNFPFPLEILKSCPRRPAAMAADMDTAAAISIPVKKQRRRLIHSVDALLGMREGDGRNEILFDYTRTAAYKAIPGPVKNAGISFPEWYGQIHSIADNGDKYFAEFLPAAEVNSIAQSIALYCWNHVTFRPGGGRHSGIDAETYSAIQSIRREIGIRQKRQANRRRDRQIVRNVLSGKSLRQAAALAGISLASIQAVMRRYNAADNAPEFWNLWEFDDKGGYV